MFVRADLMSRKRIDYHRFFPVNGYPGFFTLFLLRAACFLTLLFGPHRVGLSEFRGGGVGKSFLEFGVFHLEFGVFFLEGFDALLGLFQISEGARDHFDPLIEVAWSGEAIQRLIVGNVHTPSL